MHLRRVVPSALERDHQIDQPVANGLDLVVEFGEMMLEFAEAGVFEGLVVDQDSFCAFERPQERTDKRFTRVDLRIGQELVVVDIAILARLRVDAVLEGKLLVRNHFAVWRHDLVGRLEIDVGDGVDEAVQEAPYRRPVDPGSARFLCLNLDLLPRSQWELIRDIPELDDSFPVEIPAFSAPTRQFEHRTLGDMTPALAHERAVMWRHALDANLGLRHGG